MIESSCRISHFSKFSHVSQGYLGSTSVKQLHHCCNFSFTQLLESNVCFSILHRISADSSGSQCHMSQKFLLQFSLIWDQQYLQNITAKCNR